MELPRAVIEAEERSNAAIAQMLASKTPEPSPPNTETPAPDPALAAPPAPPTQPEPKAEAERTDWKAKYLVLEGKYRAEVPRLHDDIRELKEEVKALKSVATPPTPAAPPVDESGFDPDLLALINRKAEEKARELMQPIEKSMVETKAAAASTAFARFEVGLNASLTSAGIATDYREIDTDPEWHEFLAVEDELSGIPRQKILERAVNEGNVPRATKLFETFAKLKGRVPQPAPASPPRVPVTDVAPAPAASTRPMQQAKVWTGKEVADFFADCARGRFRGQEKRMSEIEAEIDLAAREGRIAR